MKKNNKMNKTEFLTFRIPEEALSKYNMIWDEFNEVLPCGVSRTYVLKALLVMGMETWEKQKGFPKSR